MFSATEEQAGKAVCVIGATVQRNLFRSEDPVGQRFRIRGLSCLVIGTLVARGQGGFGNDQDDVVLMPIKAVQRRLTGNRNVRLMMVKVDPAYDTAAVTASLQSLLRERRNIRGAEAGRFQHLRHGADFADVAGHHPDSHRAARRGRSREPARGRHWHHEHHAGVGDRADARNRHPSRHRRRRARGAAAVPRGSRRAGLPRRA